MIICDAPQGTKEWRQCRCGIPSASEFDKIVTSEGKPSKQRTKYLYRLAGERASGIVEESYQNGDMLRGKEMEDEARQLYSLMYKVKIQQVGFCKVAGKVIYGCSPDGLIGKSGLIEIKCPKMEVHVGYLMDNTLPTDYFQQIQGQLLVTGRKFVDFVSYYPGIKPLIIRAYRDKKFLKLLEPELLEFCNELTQMAKKIKQGAK
ncbi:MAG TPA: hypothetical protein DEP85_04845 [Holosporales bacterium]|nr:hypothetical protein [Holosporales bacterium]